MIPAFVSILAGCAGPTEEQLTSPDCRTRVHAIDALSGPQARARRPQLEKWATLSCGLKGSVRAVAGSALERADAAWWAAPRLPDDADLAAADPEMRRRALVLLDREAILAALPEVEALALHDPDPEVRAEALRALGWSGAPSALPVLDGLIGTAEGAAAAEGLRALGSEEACARVAEITAFCGPPILDPAVDPDGSRAKHVRYRLIAWGCGSSAGR